MYYGMILCALICAIRDKKKEKMLRYKFILDVLWWRRRCVNVEHELIGHISMAHICYATFQTEMVQCAMGFYIYLS